MAVYETSKSASYGISYGPGQARQIITDCAIVAVTTAMLDNANDDVGLLWVPKGAVIVGAKFHASDMDTNGSPALVWDIGDAADEDRLIAAATTGQAAGSTMTLATTGFLYKYTARTQIRAYVKTAAATGAAGTIYFSIEYFVDPEFSTTALVAA